MPLKPGKRYKMKIKLDDIAWRLPKGHKFAGGNLNLLLPDDVASARARDAHRLCRKICSFTCRFRKDVANEAAAVMGPGTGRGTRRCHGAQEAPWHKRRDHDG